MAPPDLALTNMALTTIRPFQMTAHLQTINPTSTDMFFADMYLATLFAYRLAEKSDSEYQRLVDRMKESLGRAVIPFFSFAGRWIVGGSKGRELLCNDAGVPFIEANVDEDLDAVVDASLDFQEVPALQGYRLVGMNFANLKQEVPPDGLPPVFVQVTRFRCGGVTLAVNFNHIHTDLKGFFNFMTAWSDLSRDGHTAAQVDHNRVVLDADALEKLDRQPTLKKNDDDSSDSAFFKRPWAVKAFEVSASAIAALKREAKSNKSGPGFVSTQDCIAAHIWISLARLPSSAVRGRVPTINLVVEGRRKFFDPPLSDDLCGNVITPLQPPDIPAEQLAAMPVAAAACKLRELLESTPRKHWRSAERIREMIAGHESGRVAVVSITSAFKSPLYEMDFGAGKPCFARCVGTLWKNSRPRQYFGTVTIAPPIPGGSPSAVAIANVFSYPEILQALENDPFFLSLFLGRN